MKKIALTLAITTLCLTSGYSLRVSSGSSVKNHQIKDEKAPIAMNQMPIIKDKSVEEVNIDQPKQKEQLVGSNASTWTPKYLEVKDFKKCLKTEDYRGWQGYCFPEEQPEDCPDDSWDQLKEMNLVPCSK